MIARFWRWLSKPPDFGPPYCFSRTASHWTGFEQEVCDQPGCWYDEDGRLHCYWEEKECP